MPIYEYECGQCDHHLEALQKISEAPLVYCPECGEAGLRKQVSAAAFRLKGTGWYETDFKNDKKEKKGETEKSKNQKSGEEPAQAAGEGKDAAKTASSETAESGSTKKEAKPTQKSGSSDESSKTSGGASSGSK